ncbi:UNVERIFIED_CONTAM: hypothetical protein FKN15_006504 [Acipenser sinensis]
MCHQPTAFFSHCGLTMQPPKSYSDGGQHSSGQLTGKPTGAQPDYRGRWCAVSQGHPGRPNPPSPRAALGQLSATRWKLPSSVSKGIAWTQTRDVQTIERILHSTWSAFTGCASREPLTAEVLNGEIRVHTAQLTATTPVLTRDDEDEHTLSSEACAISRPLFFHTADSPCSHPRATATEDNTALGSLQASPQVPSQTTGVAGARLPADRRSLLLPGQVKGPRTRVLLGGPGRGGARRGGGGGGGGVRLQSFASPLNKKLRFASQQKISKPQRLKCIQKKKSPKHTMQPTIRSMAIPTKNIAVLNALEGIVAKSSGLPLHVSSEVRALLIQ